MSHRLMMLALVLTLHLGGAELRPVGLTTEMRHEPIGIDAARPRFGWTLESGRIGAHSEMQSAYQILVASTPEHLRANTADLWDSGRVASTTFWQLSYGGSPLKAHTTYYWKAKVWNGSGVAGDWSDSATFTTALLASGDWSAKWIAAEPDRGESKQALENREEASITTPPPLPIFRKDFRLTKSIAQALLFVSGLGQYEARLNGVNVTNTVLNPGWSDYRKTVPYDSYDVKNLLKPGENAFGVLLGNGMYNVEGIKGRYAKFIGSFGQPKCILQLEVRYKDGTEERFVSDASWKTHAGPIRLSSTYGGEDYDANAEPRGWDQAGFNGMGWQQALEVGGPGGMLSAEKTEPMVQAEHIAAVHMTKPAAGVTVCDLGKNMSGWPEIRVRGAANSSIRMLPGELLDKMGMVSQWSAHASAEDPVLFQYKLRGDKEGETWHPRFSYYGFRYVQITTQSAFPGSGQPEVLSLSGDFVHDQVATAGSFTSSNQLFDRIHALIDRAVLSNLASVVTDCPHREKLGWLEQTYLNAGTLMLNYGVTGLYEKMTRDMLDAQLPDGLVPGIAPEYVAFVNDEGKSTPFRDSPEWGSAVILSPWALYQLTADAEPLREAYPAMKRYAEHLRSRSENHMLSFGLGDWYDVGPGAPGESQLTSKWVTASATYYEDLRVLGSIAEFLGKSDEAQQFAKEAAGVRDAFNAKLYDPATHKYDRGSQTAQAMPLALGMVPKAAEQAVLENLVADIRAHDYHVTAGDVGFHYVVRALTDHRRSDVLAAMLSRTDSPSYGYQLAQGATTLTEAWDTNPESSQNHFMLGHGEEWFYRGLAGISVDMARGAAKAIELRPSLVDSVQSASAEYKAAMGLVRSGWHKTTAGAVFEMTIPIGSTATVWLPMAGQLVGGDFPGVTKKEKTAAGWRIDVGSGTYEFDLRHGS